MRRRDFLPALAAPLACCADCPPIQRKGRIKQGVTRGVFAREHEHGGLLPRSRPLSALKDSI